MQVDGTYNQMIHTFTDNAVRGGNGGIFDSSGHFIATDGRAILDAHGNIISIVGHQTDICAAIGSSSAS